MMLALRYLSLGITVLGFPAIAADGPLSVFVSVVPLKTCVERIGGDQVQVEVMVPPGHSPATYDPTPRQVSALSDADLYVRVGVPFEDAWMQRIRAASPEMAVLDVRDGLMLRPQGKHDDGDHRHGAMDAHVWTSPRQVQRMAAGIRDALSGLAPQYAARFAANHDAFVADLDALDQELRARLSGLRNRRFLVFHPAWGYFADTYGLTQIAIEHEGKEPGARALAALIDQARREHVAVIFVQPQFNRRAAEQVAAAIRGRVEVIDPLAADYFRNLRHVADVIAASDAARAGDE
jgi:zinc transport system substrate-binding protein